MRNRWFLYFWTEFGRRILDPDSVSEPPRNLPSVMAEVLLSKPPAAGRSVLQLEKRLDSRKARYIYMYTWEILREHGFSRPLRLEPWPGITLFLPFFKNNIAVIPQSFSERVPPSKRALSLVGRSAAALIEGYELWVVPAVWDDGIISIFREGGVKACSPDELDGICKSGLL
ncbi:MAG: hypothetical protein KAQ97_02975 [Candidatus Fermentibacteraceae bacterium]|nr:hypothetical protein [Candidatus Fermentibacteraceae bacterium]